MATARAQASSSRAAFYAFFLAAFSCALGLAFCLVKSPQARSDAYLAAAFEAEQNQRFEQAGLAAFEAVRLNPVSADAWRMLAKMLQQNGDKVAAAKARSIAARMQQNPAGASPVYAMPADFKLSLLALAEQGTP